MFFVTEILREINFGDSRSAKSVILTHVVALNFDLYEFLHVLNAVYRIIKIQSSKNGSFRISTLPKIDFT